jgi:acyl carrier protein
MTSQEFINIFSEKLQISRTDLTIETNLDSLDEWDSWNKLALMTLLDERFKINLTSKELGAIHTIKDIIVRIGDKVID